MTWLVSISALPDRAEQLKVEAPSSIEALRDVLSREMMLNALNRRPGAALCISVMKPVKSNGQLQALGGLLP